MNIYLQCTGDLDLGLFDTDQDLDLEKERTVDLDLDLEQDFEGLEGTLNFGGGCAAEDSCGTCAGEFLTLLF